MKPTESGPSSWLLRAGCQRGAALLGLCSALLACSGRADIPDTPDLSVMQGQFEHPTAVLDETTVAETLHEIPSLRNLAAAFRAAGANTTRGVQTAGNEAKPGSRLNIQGSIHVTVRCPGDLDVPAFGQSGTLSMTLGVQKNLIKRGIRLDASGCVMRGSALGIPIRVEVDGPVYIDLGRDVGLGQGFSGRILIYIAGTLDAGGLVLDDLAARVMSERVEYLFRLPNDPDNAWVIASMTEDGNISIQDSQTTWGCSDGQACAR
jgi:hypothetical protein